MTDEALRDLVVKHETSISSLLLVSERLSEDIKNLVSSQHDTSKRLEEIAKYLAKQAVFSSKIEDMDKNIAEGFKRRDDALYAGLKRVHLRLDDIDKVQKSEAGCNSVRLLTKDVEHLTKEMETLVLTVSNVATTQSKILSPTALRWILGIVFVASMGFGSYVVRSLGAISQDLYVHHSKSAAVKEEMRRFEHWLGFMEVKQGER